MTVFHLEETHNDVMMKGLLYAAGRQKHQRKLLGSYLFGMLLDCLQTRRRQPE
jgi:hypothetical protein